MARRPLLDHVGRADRRRPARSIVRTRERRPDHGPVRWGQARWRDPAAAAGGAPARRSQSGRGDLARFATGTYDLAWFFDVRAWVLAGAPDLAPTVIDYDDLEHHKIKARLAVDSAGGVRPAPGRHGPSLPRRWGHLPGRGFSQLEARRWARLYRSASSHVAQTVVCSPLDAGRAASGGVSNVAVVPNAYPRPDRPVGRSAVGSPPVVLFHGTLRYPPNADAGRGWSAGSVRHSAR